MTEFNAGEFVDTNTIKVENPPPVVEVAPPQPAVTREREVEGGFQEIPPITESTSGNGIDSSGTVFNRELHCEDENGLPRKNKDGTFRKRKKKDGQPEPVRVEVMGKNFESPAKPSTLQMIGFMLDTVSLCTVKMMGPEWKPSDDERIMLVDVWARYVEYKGWDLSTSPDFVVIAATAAFLMPRLMLPGGFISRYLNRNKKNAHPNNRATGNGENHDSQNNGSPVQSSGLSS